MNVKDDDILCNVSSSESEIFLITPNKQLCTGNSRILKAVARSTTENVGALLLRACPPVVLLERVSQAVSRRS